MEQVGLAPPRLAPVSGVLNQGEGVIKPIACRPQVSSATSTPIMGNRHSGSQQQLHQQHLQGLKPVRNPVSGSSSSSEPRSSEGNPRNSQRLSWNRLETANCGSANGLCSLPCESVTLPSRNGDLNRKFGGSLCSVASGSSLLLNQGRQRPPPYRQPVAKSSAVFSSSEVHLDRVTRQQTAQQRLLGGSEVNLSNLGYSANGSGTLPRTRFVHNSVHADNSLYSCSGNYSSSAGRSSWAGLTSATQSSSGSTLTLAADAERRDDTATPIVEGGKIRSCTQADNTAESVDSLGDFDEDSARDRPSPSDSGIAELESLLKEKDSEILLLRETLEQNEAVIFQVYQEKEKSWERELKKLRTFYEERVRAANQQASQAERQLHLLQQQWDAERKQTKQQIQQLKSSNEALRNQLDETSWTLCHKNGELSLVKSQLKEAQSDQNQRCQEVAKLRGQLKEAQELMQSTRQRLENVLYERQQQESDRLTSPLACRKFGSPETSDVVQHLKSEILRLQRRLNEQQQQTEVERQIWEEEKSTVMLYQRHLQQQYVQAMKRNQQLEETLGLLGFTGVPAISTSPNPAKEQPLASPKSVCSDPITIDLDSTSNSSGSESQC